MIEAVVVEKPTLQPTTERERLERNLLLAQGCLGEPVRLDDLCKYFIVVKLLRGVSIGDL